MNKVFFLRPNEKNSEVVSTIIKLISKSKKLLLCISYFSSPEISKVLIERIKDGKETLIILNMHDLIRPKYNKKHESTIYTSKALKDLLKYTNFWSDEPHHPLKIKLLGRDGKSIHSVMHHKFILTEDKVLFGSLNLTINSLNNNYENVVLSDDKDLLFKFSSEFEELWKIATSFSNKNGKIRGLVCPECKMEGGVDFESFGAMCINCGHQFPEDYF